MARVGPQRHRGEKKLFFWAIARRLNFVRRVPKRRHEMPTPGESPRNKEYNIQSTTNTRILQTYFRKMK